MSARPNDGGPAFARGSTLYPNSTLFTESQPGMSLRDWFAGQALAGYAQFDRDDMSCGHIASNCYRLADAMLAARKTSTGGQE